MAARGLREPVKGFLRHRNVLFSGPSMVQQSRFLVTDSTSSQSLDQAYLNAHLSSTPTKPILEDTFTAPPLPAPSSTASKHSYQPPANPFLTTATCTLYSFPNLEPTTTIQYPSTHLLLPLRRDILHRAIIYEGDKTRQGTASTKWRTEIHGSNRKIRPQKGTGSARLGNKKSPMLRGGGVAFGPKPRDFSTDLPRKVYDLAWRTALSYRYRRGELFIVDGEAEIQRSGPGTSRWVKEMLEWHNWGNADGRSFFITERRRHNLFNVLEEHGMGAQARAKTIEHIDVKNLLEMGRLVIERDALREIFRKRSSDL